MTNNNRAAWLGFGSAVFCYVVVGDQVRLAFACLFFLLASLFYIIEKKIDQIQETVSQLHHVRE